MCFYLASSPVSPVSSMVAYSLTTAALSTAAFGGLIYTLVAIRRNLAALNEHAGTWPPVKEVGDKPRRQSFGTEDIDGFREGSSWLTSDAGSHHEVTSNWSFSTHHQSHNARFNPTGSQLTLAPKSSFWFNAPSSPDPSIPPVPPLPPPYRRSSSPTCVITDDPSRPRLGSQSSWLTSSAWSFPQTQHGGSIVDIHAELLSPAMASRPATPAALFTAQVLGGYGYTSGSEKGIASLAVNDPGVDISYVKYVSWLLSIWVPVVRGFARLWSSLYSREYLQGLSFLDRHLGFCSIQRTVADAGTLYNVVLSPFGTQHLHSLAHSNPNWAI